MAVRGKKKPDNDPSYRSMKAEYYPVQRQVQLATTAGGTKYLLDVARQLSVVNHRLYRQGKTYQVKIDIDNRADVAIGPAQYDVYALTDTWYVQKAWQLARAQYLRSTAAERANMSQQQRARWEDFRVTAGISGSQVIVPYQYSETLVGAVNTDGEFQTSVIVLEDGTTQRTFTWGSTPSASEYSMLQEYDKSGNTEAHPATQSADKAYSGTEDLNEAQMDALAGNGNSPPYNNLNFTDNVWVKVATLDNSGTGNAGDSSHSRMSTGFFNAPCGLVVIVPSISHTLAGDLSMTVKAGQYKGTAAMNMGV
jgi:hypothetical protein